MKTDLRTNFLARVLLKGLLLYLALDLLLGLLGPLPLGRVSIYNGLVPGRARFPFGETPQAAYNFSLFDLDAMFAAHQVSAPKAPGEFRVLLIGDSSVWGTLLRPEQTLAGQLNRLNLRAADGRAMRFYNLGYPTVSLTKDLLILDQARATQPDLVIWLVTLEAFPLDKQLSVPLVQNNPARVRDLLRRYDLPFAAEALPAPGFWDYTLIGQRKSLADWLRLQLYGVMWAATGVDQLYPAAYPRAENDQSAEAAFHGKTDLTAPDLALPVLAAGQQALGDVPLIVVNEPILVSDGKNSTVRYNFYYPRRAYDQYRALLMDFAAQQGINYVDAWNSVPKENFTNSAIHVDALGVGMLAERVAGVLGR